MNQSRATVTEARTEFTAYEAALPMLLKKHDQQFVVIHGSEIAERFFDSYVQAVEWAYETFGLGPFFVKQISEQENATHFIRDLGCSK